MLLSPFPITLEEPNPPCLIESFFSLHSPLVCFLPARVLAIHPTLNLSRYLFSLLSWSRKLDIPPSVGVFVAEFVVSGDDGDWGDGRTALNQEDVDRHLMSLYNYFLSYALCRVGCHSQSFCTDCGISDMSVLLSCLGLARLGLAWPVRVVLFTYVDCDFASGPPGYRGNSEKKDKEDQWM
ncbi:hypothetical protein P168DRAFT_25489 [Aspergillus campestris IBT 28561]|uniref:Uncharacterized protein n=1 Tax=Aspergillus campestris (strain IBT 28561) TaxID=1392248 RepID=A0A2I1DG77_ASPC2|nr:uncharacterized protein P168DRAFT_25489 [Aspergillus campestris IBT 28561]PKY08873.1 hypothetical protein P168DRAFT_25489 [Aspergillus campestris IBT 28561]